MLEHHQTPWLVVEQLKIDETFSQKWNYTFHRCNSIA